MLQTVRERFSWQQCEAITQPPTPFHVTPCGFAAAVKPLHASMERHLLAAERLHGDDTTVPILAKRPDGDRPVWVYVRDDRPFGGKDPPAALFYASRDRTRASRAASGRMRRHYAS